MDSVLGPGRGKGGLIDSLAQSCERHRQCGLLQHAKKKEKEKRREREVEECLFLPPRTAEAQAGWKLRRRRWRGSRDRRAGHEAVRAPRAASPSLSSPSPSGSPRLHPHLHLFISILSPVRPPDSTASTPFDPSSQRPSASRRRLADASQAASQPVLASSVRRPSPPAPCVSVPSPCRRCVLSLHLAPVSARDSPPCSADGLPRLYDMQMAMLSFLPMEMTSVEERKFRTELNTST